MSEEFLGYLSMSFEDFILEIITTHIALTFFNAKFILVFVEIPQLNILRKNFKANISKKA